MNERNSHPWDIVVLGGGAAGFMAAITVKESSPHSTVALLEKGAGFLAKVRVSGGGRCNVTHACFDPLLLTQHYPRGRKELLGAFHRWQPADTVDWFESRGVPLIVEPDGRMFPKANHSSAVVNCLMESARSAGIQMRTHFGFDSIGLSSEGWLEMVQDNGEVIRCKKLLVATGGLKPGALHKSLIQLGHAIEPLAPSLFAFHIRDSRLSGLSGLSVGDARVSIPQTDFEQQGPMLITHQGLSGPAILKLSAWAARWIHERQYQFGIHINWTGGCPEQAILEQLKHIRDKSPDKRIDTCPQFGIPKRLWERLMFPHAVGKRPKWKQQTVADLLRIVGDIRASAFQVHGKSMNKEEFVTCGGVSLRDVDFKTMESRVVPRLYFAGEVLDIDAVTGGFNFQAAWTTGRIAGLAMAAI